MLTRGTNEKRKAKEREITNVLTRGKKIKKRVVKGRKVKCLREERRKTGIK